MKNNKKAISTIIVTIMILMITIVSYISINQWYIGLSSEIQIKQKQELRGLNDKFEILGIKQEGVDYNLYLKSNTYGYIIIKTLKLNGNECILTSSNVILGKQINKIGIDCPSIGLINEIMIYASTELIQGKVKITT